MTEFKMSKPCVVCGVAGTGHCDSVSVCLDCYETGRFAVWCAKNGREDLLSLEKRQEKERTLNAEQSMVRDFHKAFGIPYHDKPHPPDLDCTIRRKNLIMEETLELITAMMNRDMIDIADAIADLLYVVYGTAVECGLDMEPFFKEVHRSNMSKVGGTRREDGKWVKPANYSPAELYPILKTQNETK